MTACVHGVLRDYQIAARESLYAVLTKDERRGLLYLPTGAGKTETGYSIIADALEAGHRVLVILDQIVLARQWRKRAGKVGIDAADVGVLRGEDTDNVDAPLILASAQTLDARQKSIATPAWLARFKCVIVDECHVMREAHKRAVTAVTDAGGVAFGMTATPDARGLRELYGELVKGSSISDLTPRYLVPCKVKVPTEANVMYRQALRDVRVRAGEYVADELSDAMSDPRLTASAVKVWAEHAEGKPTLVFCTSKAHADAVGKSFTSYGISNAVMTEETPIDTRDELIAEFEAGNITVLVSINVLAVGFDCPRAEVGLMLRPTKSVMCWIQQCGRLLRPYEGKDHALLLDLAGNTLDLCHPENYQPPKKLLKRGEPKPEQSRATAKVCPECETVVEIGTAVCPECHAQLIQANDQPGTGRKRVQMREVGPEANAADLPLRDVYLMFLHLCNERGTKAGAAYFRTQEFWRHEHGYEAKSIAREWQRLPTIEPIKAILDFDAASRRAYARRMKAENPEASTGRARTWVDENGKTKINIRGW